MFTFAGFKIVVVRNSENLSKRQGVNKGEYQPRLACDVTKTTLKSE